MLAHRPTYLSAIVVVCMAALAACGETNVASARTRATLVFTAIPDHNTTELAAKFGPVANYLSATLGVPVEYQPTNDYQASVEAFKNGDVQLAWFGGLTGVQARAAVEGARAIAQGRSDPTFRSYFIAHADTGLSRSNVFPADIGGLRFTFGSESSTSGRLMPESFIRSHTGMPPDELFGRPNHYSGSHDKTAALVEAGTFDVGAINYKTYDRLVEEQRLDPEVCRVIWVSPEYPDYNWTAHPDLDATYGAGFTQRLQAALIAMDDPALLAAVDRPEGIVPATNDDFEPIRALAVELGFLR